MIPQMEIHKTICQRSQLWYSFATAYGWQSTFERLRERRNLCGSQSSWQSCLAGDADGRAAADVQCCTPQPGHRCWQRLRELDSQAHNNIMQSAPFLHLEERTGRVNFSLMCKTFLFVQRVKHELSGRSMKQESDSAPLAFWSYFRTT